MQNFITRLRIKYIFLTGISISFHSGCASNPFNPLPEEASPDKITKKITVRKLICHSCDGGAPKIKKVTTSKRKKYQPIVLEVK